jgi:hypothetical protein
MAEIPYGQVALFDTAADIYHAAEKVRDAGYKRWDVYSPFPIHGMDEAMGLKRSKVTFFCLTGGVSGFLLGMLMVWFMNDFDYPLIVGAKPFFSPIYSFPIIYEMTILLAAFGAFFGMFLTNFLPQHYHPAMNYSNFNQVTDDKFIIIIESSDNLYDEIKTKSLLEEIGGKEITALEE